MTPRAAAPPEEQLIRRICGEFLEMPGLQLTCAQAQLLFGVDASHCARVLDQLVALRFLTRRPNGMYARWTGDERRAPRRAAHAIHLQRASAD